VNKKTLKRFHINSMIRTSAGVFLQQLDFKLVTNNSLNCCKGIKSIDRSAYLRYHVTKMLSWKVKTVIREKDNIRRVDICVYRIKTSYQLILCGLIERRRVYIEQCCVLDVRGSAWNIIGSLDKSFLSFCLPPQHRRHLRRRRGCVMHHQPVLPVQSSPRHTAGRRCSRHIGRQ